MRKILLSFSLLFAVTAVDAQKKNKEKYSQAVFTMNDGSEKNVLFVAYTFPTESLYAFMKGSDIYKFEYKLEPEGKLLKVDASELQKVKFLDEFEDERLGLERLKLKAVNDKGVVDDKAYNSWQPLLYDGKIKIYGSNLYSCSGSICTFVFSKFYLRNEKDDFAVMPIDFDRLNLLNLGKMDEKMVEAFRLVGKGCPEFNKYLDGFYAKLQEKSFRKQVNEDMKKARQRGFAEAKAEKLGYRATQDRVGRYVMEYNLNLYTGIVREYEKNCPH